MVKISTSPCFVLYDYENLFALTRVLDKVPALLGESMPTTSHTDTVGTGQKRITTLNILCEVLQF